MHVQQLIWYIIVMNKEISNASAKAEPDLFKDGVGGRNMMYKPPRSTAIFLWIFLWIFLQDRGDLWPPFAPPHPESDTDAISSQKCNQAVSWKQTNHVVFSHVCLRHVFLFMFTFIVVTPEILSTLQSIRMCHRYIWCMVNRPEQSFFT